MIIIEREKFKKEKKGAFKFIYEELLKIHKVADHTVNNLHNTNHIKDFCEEAKHFLLINIDDPKIDTLHISYDVSTWLGEFVNNEQGYKIRIERITLYDNYLEYELYRKKGLMSDKQANIPKWDQN